MHRLLPVMLFSLAFGVRAAPPEQEAPQAAGKPGDTTAMLQQAWQLQQQADLPAALESFRRAAEAGSVEAQYHLAQSYLNGALGTVDPAAAEYWYGRVREHGVCPSVIRPPDAF